MQLSLGARPWTENVDNYVKSIAADNLGGVHIVFCTRFDANGWGGGIFYSRSTNGGENFDEIAYKIATNNNGQPTVTAEAIGNVYVSWSAGDAIYFTKRLANSSTWTTPVPVSTARIREGAVGLM